MTINRKNKVADIPTICLVSMLIFSFLLPPGIGAREVPDLPQPRRESILSPEVEPTPGVESTPAEENNLSGTRQEIILDPEGEIIAEEPQETEEMTVVVDPDSPYGLDGRKIFNPDPTRAVWLSALCPGLGQIYNRRYWKLPIVVGGFMGLIYATNWNNNQYSDYSNAFRDITDSDPTTKSYMDFFPPTTLESDLDKAWLTSVMQSRKNYYRRNRDLCIICMVALYLVCMVDAYVDASMAHFDISPDLSLDLTPTMIVNPDRKFSLGLNWAFTF